MIVTNEEIVLTAEQQEKLFWDNWKFESHRWLEHSKGYFTCDFCGVNHTSRMPLSIQNLCMKNPFITELEAVDLLLKTSKAYKGVKDFEGTGVNMSAIITDIRKVLESHGLINNKLIT